MTEPICDIFDCDEPATSFTTDAINTHNVRGVLIKTKLTRQHKRCDKHAIAGHTTVVAELGIDLPNWWL